jgi:hypothetical protein
LKYEPLDALGPKLRNLRPPKYFQKITCKEFGRLPKKLNKKA